MRRVPMALAALAVAAALASAAWVLRRTGSDAPPRGPAPEPSAPAVAAAEPPAATAPAASEPETVAREDASGMLRVLDDEGTPLAGADVAFVEFDPRRPQPWLDAAWESGAVVAAVFDRGRLLRTGTDGCAALPAFAAAAQVAARHGALAGAMDVSCDQPPPWELRLAVQRRVNVLVLDSAGDPAPGVPVGIAADWLGSPATIWRGTTGVDGTQTLVLADDSLADALDARVAALAVGRDMPQVPFDPRGAGDVSVELRLPPTGALRVVLRTLDGTPFRGAARVVVMPADDATETSAPRTELARWQRADAVEGVALFPRVGLGVRLHVLALDPDDAWLRAETSCAGPVAAGQEAAVEVVVGQALPVVVGRLVTPDGVPVDGQAFVARLVVDPELDVLDDLDLDATTDAAGRFRLAFAASLEEGASAALEIGRHAATPWGGVERDSVVTVELSALEPGGVTDVGDVTTDAFTKLVAGRVLDASGAPLADAEIVISRKTSYGALDLGAAKGARSGPDGTFDVRGAAQRGRLLVSAQARGWYLPEPHEFGAGATGVELRLRTAGGVAGRIRMADVPRGFLVSVRVRSVAETGAAHADSRLTRLADLDTATGAFELFTLPPGTATVEVWVGFGDTEPALVVPDVAVVAGELTRDPRLADIDLSAAARSPAGPRGRDR